MYKYKMKIDGVAAWLQSGTLSIIDGRIYLCEWPLTELVKQFEGQQIEIAVAPVESTYKLDEKIKPLVEKLQSLGVRTISSCEGHLNDTMHPPYPWVALAGTFPVYTIRGMAAVQECGWKVVPQEYIQMIRTIKEATNEAELVELQNSITRLVEKL